MRDSANSKLGQQQRSLQSRRRILAAAQRTLNNKEFAAATLAEIAAQAGLTTGAIYGRFANKAALLAELEGEARGYLEERWQAALAGPSSIVLEERLRRFIRAAIEAFTSHRGTLRALTVAANSDKALRRRLNAMNQRLLADFTAAVRQHRDELAHPDPDLAAKVGLLIITSALREVLLFGDVWPAIGGPNIEQLEAELHCAVLVYWRKRPS